MKSSVWCITGASGTGKSTRSRAIARECDLDRLLVISTDVVRAQLRATMNLHEHPELIGESFSVPIIDGDQIIEATDGSEVNVGGFLRQCQTIMAAINAAIAYGVTEGWDIIVEGIHLMPGMVDLIESVDMQFELMNVRDTNDHAERFHRRSRASRGGRPAAHYIANLPRIEVIQDVITTRWDTWITTVQGRSHVTTQHIT